MGGGGLRRRRLRLRNCARRAAVVRSFHGSTAIRRPRRPNNPVLHFALVFPERRGARDYDFRMLIDKIPFGVTDWTQVPASVRPGDTGTATWRTREFDDVRVRMVEYSPGYLADHWCNKGHILLVLAGTLTAELASGQIVTLQAGSSYQVGDHTEAHRSSSDTGARLFIVD